MNIGLGIGIPFTRSSLWSNIFTPTALFMDGSTEGVWYDPSDLSTLFQDAAGTTPVTAIEQPVGLMLDKSKGLVLGPELVTNGAFASNLSGWTQSTPNYWTWVNGRAYHANSANYNDIAQTFTTFSKPVQIEFDYECLTASNTAEWFYINAAGVVKSYASDGIPRLAAGVGKMRYVALDGIQRIGFSRYIPAAAEFYIDNISVRELSGNHAYQTVSTKRPVLSARVNLLTKTEDFSDVAWSVAGVTRSSDGTITSTVATGYLYPTAGGFLASASGASYTWIVDVVRGNTSSFKLLVSSATIYQATFDIDAQTVSGVSVNTTASITNLGAGVYRCTLVMSAVANSAYTEFQIGRLASGQTLRLIRSDLRLTNTGVNLPAYQRVNTSTDYDTQGFPLSVRFDGIDDSMQTNSIDFSATDKMTVVAGVRKLSDAADRPIIVELGSNSDASNGFALQPSAPATFANYRLQLYGTSRGVRDTPSQFSAPITSVISGRLDIAGSTISGEVIGRINGNQAFTIDTLSPAGTGNYGNYPLYIGARAGTSLFFNGLLYQLVIAGGSVINIAEEDLDLVLNEAGDSITAETTVPIGISTIEACERFVNRKTLAY